MCTSFKCNRFLRFFVFVRFSYAANTFLVDDLFFVAVVVWVWFVKPLIIHSFLYDNPFRHLIAWLFRFVFMGELVFTSGNCTFKYFIALVKCEKKKNVDPFCRTLMVIGVCMCVCDCMKNGRWVKNRTQLAFVNLLWCFISFEYTH